MTGIPERVAHLLLKIARPVLIMALIAAVYGGYQAYSTGSDLAKDIVKCGDAVMPKDSKLVCAKSGTSRYGGSTREQMRANNEEQAQRDRTLAIIGGVLSVLAGGALIVARQSVQAHARSRAATMPQSWSGP
jgi:hypothetical protein